MFDKKFGDDLKVKQEETLSKLKNCSVDEFKGILENAHGTKDLPNGKKAQFEYLGDLEYKELYGYLKNTKASEKLKILTDYYQTNFRDSLSPKSQNKKT